MLKFKIDNDAYNALDDAQQTLYEQVGDEFVLKVEGAPDASEIERLKQHNEKLIGEKRQRDEAARQAQAERERIEQEAAKKNGDFEALEKSYQQKLQEREDELNALRQQQDTQRVNTAASQLAQQLSDNQSNQMLLQRFIKDRLSVVDGQVKVTDADGKPSASTIDDLANEFKTSGVYDSLLTGTRASGTGGQGQGGTADKLPSEYTEAERVELAKTNPEQFKRLFT